MDMVDRLNYVKSFPENEWEAEARQYGFGTGRTGSYLAELTRQASEEQNAYDTVNTELERVKSQLSQPPTKVTDITPSIDVPARAGARLLPDNYSWAEQTFIDYLKLARDARNVEATGDYDALDQNESFTQKACQ